MNAIAHYRLNRVDEWEVQDEGEKKRGKGGKKKKRTFRWTFWDSTGRPERSCRRIQGDRPEDHPHVRWRQH